jgi:hypothetical protein
LGRGTCVERTTEDEREGMRSLAEKMETNSDVNRGENETVEEIRGLNSYTHI